MTYIVVVTLSKADWLFIAFANAVCAVVAVVSARFALGWKAASLLAVVEIAMLGWYCFTHREKFFARLFVFGVVAGFVELLNDTWLVAGKRVLVYDPGGPFIVDTPLYMPFTWALIFVTLGSIALWLRQRLRRAAAPAIAAAAALYIPGFEAVARLADWCFYQHVPMCLGLAPWFVVVGEALLAVPLPAMADALSTPLPWWRVVLLGVVQGLVIWGTSVIAFGLCG
jgi:hypothetical protein